MLSIQPYLTLNNAIIFTGLGIFYAVLMQNIAIIFGIALLLTSIISTYPFLVGDKTGIDSLYRVFGLKEKEIVLGRYVSSLLVAVAIQIIAIFLAWILSLFIKTEDFWMMILSVIPVYLIMSQLLVCLQYPFYFKYGYTKAKLMMSMTFILFGVIGFIASYFREQTLQIIVWGANHKFLIILLMLTILAVIYYVSIYYSTKWYQEKDLV